MQLNWILTISVILFLLLMSVPFTASAEHATCTGDNATCGVAMDWSWIFQNTYSDYNTISYSESTSDILNSTDDTDVSRTQPGNLAGLGDDLIEIGGSEADSDSPSPFDNTLAGVGKSNRRNLYHGIQLTGNNNTTNVVTGRTPIPSIYDNYTQPWLEIDNIFRPPSLQTAYNPAWFPITNEGNKVKFEGQEEPNDIILTEEETKFVFESWEDDMRYKSMRDQIVDDDFSTWNTVEWKIKSNFTPKFARLNASLPKGTNAKLEVFRLVDKSEIEDDPEDYKIGEAVFSGDQSEYSGNNDTKVKISSITHGLSDLTGLEEYDTPKYDDQNLSISGLDANAKGVTYHVRLTMERQNTSVDSPKVSFSEPLTLSEYRPRFRSDHPTWDSYPQNLPTFTNPVGDELQNVTSYQSSGLDSDFVIGHTEDMIQNYNREYTGLDKKNASFAPKIPREETPDQGFGHIEPSSTDSNPHFTSNYTLVNHAYADIPRVEKSFQYQEEYSDIRPSTWETLASDRGVVYAIYDMAAGEIKNNSNFGYRSGEDSGRFSDFSESISDLSMSKSDYTESELQTEATMTKYSPKSTSIEPELGAEYKLPMTNGSTEKNNFLEDEEIRMLRAISEGYNQSLIDASGTPGKTYFDGFYAGISDVTVEYRTEYQQIKLKTSICPEVQQSSEWDKEYDEDGNLKPPEEPTVHPDHTDVDNVYGSYGKYIDENHKTSRELESLDGRGECSSQLDEAITGYEWKDTDWEDAASAVDHNAGEKLVYNASDPQFEVIGGDSLLDATKDFYQINTFASDRADEQGPSTDGDIGDAFQTKTALGSESFVSRTYFDRKIDEYGSEDTRWTRSESKSVMRRGSMIANNQRNTSNSYSISVPSKRQLQNRYYKSRDYSNKLPIRNRITDDMNVYLDIYNFGPSAKPDYNGPLSGVSPGGVSDDQLRITVKNSTVYDSNLPTSLGRMKYSKLSPSRYLEPSLSSEKHSFNITNFVENGSRSVDLNLTYEPGENSDRFNRNQRIEYVITYETERPLNDVYSRWGFSTFRDDRYDVIYKFNSSRCYREEDSGCYDYKDHGIPFTAKEDKERGNYTPELQQTPPDDVETYYPSQTMFVNPYLIPSTSTISTGRTDGVGKTLNPINPVRSFVNNSNNLGLGTDSNLLSDSGINTSAKGNIRTDEDSSDLSMTLLLEARNQNTEEGGTRTFTSLNINDFFEYKDKNPNTDLGFDLKHHEYDDFPAMLKYPVKDEDGELSEMYDRNFEELTLPDGYDEDDVEINDMYVRDGVLKVNATVPDGDFFDGVFIMEGVKIAVLDIPEVTIDKWRNWGSIDESEVDDGLMFGGYNRSDLDKIRPEDEYFWEQGLDISDPFENDYPDSVKYQGTLDYWLLNSRQVNSEIQQSDLISHEIEHVDYSGLSSNLCPYDPGEDERYCNIAVNNLASYNTEEAVSKDQTDHINFGYVPQDYETKEEPYVEYGEFEYVDKREAYGSWEVAGDASWETRPTSSEELVLFDSVYMNYRPIDSITRVLNETERDNYMTNDVSHSFDVANADDRQQYRLKLEDEFGSPISTKNREESTIVKGSKSLQLPNMESKIDRPEEGICITTEGGYVGPTPNSGNCFHTDDNGELYFYVTSTSDKNPQNVVEEIQFVGSEDYWWEYFEGTRLLESKSIVLSEREISGSDKEESGSVSLPIFTILLILLIFAYVLSRALRTRFNPSEGPTTKELISTMFAPFVGTAIDRLLTILIYIVLSSIAIGVIISGFSEGNTAPFFVFDFIIGTVFARVVSAIVDALP